jgi:tRNA/rRNA methyltransferase
MSDTSFPSSPTAGRPAVILVRPQLSENIGTTARAMLNCGLTDLRLVAPRQSWLADKAIAASAGADSVLRAAQVFDDTAPAIADLQRVYATTGRNRFMVKPVVTPRQAALEMREQIASGLRCGVLFGPERTGLENDDVALADTVVTVPLNPDYCSLNLAQCVLIVGYEWYQAGDPAEPRAMTKGAAPVATKEQLIGLFEHLERELDECGFFRVAEKRPSMVRNIRNMFERADLTLQEVRTLHGIVHELVTLRLRKGEASGE